MSTGWARATKILTTAALAAVGALSVGCGPSPAYDPEPRMPSGYVQQRADGEPPTSAELQAQAEANEAARAQAAGEVAVGADDTEYADTDPSALTEFKPALEGHGAWVDDSTYGTVWVPAESEVGTDFVPYTTAGHWTYDEGPRTEWVWVSDYSWGWAPFHYGRWVHVSNHGWAWIPGRTYSGAWVSWRGARGYDYVGWAPLGPSWYWYNGSAVGWGYGYTPYYSYCHRDHIYSPGFGGQVVRGPAGREHEGRTQAFVPASPSIGGGGRVAATPSVGGAPRTAATPTVGGRVSASPQVGPRPSELGIRAESVVAPPGDHAGLARAKVLASPHTAVSSGAAPPIGTPRQYNPDVVATAQPRAFSPGSPSSSRFEAVARAPQYQGVNPVPPRPAAMPDTRSSSRSFATSSPASPSQGVSAPPSYRSSPSFSQPSQPQPSQPSPSFRSSPSVAATPQPQYRSSPSVSSPPPSFRSTPSVAATPQPQFRSTPSVSSPPSFRSLPSTPTVRSMPSTPSFRSSPSVSSPRSSPAPARPSVRSRR